jgi:hypothetical protein
MDIDLSRVCQHDICIPWAQAGAFSRSKPAPGIGSCQRLQHHGGVLVCRSMPLCEQVQQAVLEQDLDLVSDEPGPLHHMNDMNPTTLCKRRETAFG